MKQRMLCISTIFMLVLVSTVAATAMGQISGQSKSQPLPHEDGLFIGIVKDIDWTSDYQGTATVVKGLVLFNPIIKIPSETRIEFWSEDIAIQNKFADNTFMTARTWANYYPSG